jgi:lipopolysaccharide transport system ATP-binding protein
MTQLGNPTTTMQVPTDESDILVSVEHVSKKFCRDLKQSMVYGCKDVVTELCGGDRQSQVLRPKEFWAVQDVSFQLRRGEALGLVGTNGAGKSTLLRIISGLIMPDAGKVKVRGRLAPLIALGAGFNPILTGRENIYANMAILGLSTAEIQDRFQDVIEFSGIGDAIDAPVITYSSGMAARLGFSCAIYVQPDVLLIDEVLAVGDVKFRMKCHKKLADLQAQGTAFVLVSHNSHTILNVCDTSIYLSKGQLVVAGRTETVICKYEEDLSSEDVDLHAGIGHRLRDQAESEQFGLSLLAVSFRDDQGEPISSISCGYSANLYFKCRVYKLIRNLSIELRVGALSGMNERVLYIASASDGEVLEVHPGDVEVQMQMPHCGLLPGMYTAKIFLKEGVCTLDIVESFRFRVKAGKIISESLFFQPRSWHIIQS